MSVIEYDVIVIGAGAAGLTCGHYLVRIGYEVDVYEGELLFKNVDHFTIDMPLETTKLFYIGDGDAFMRFMDYPSL